MYISNEQGFVLLCIAFIFFKEYKGEISGGRRGGEWTLRVGRGKIY